MPLWSFTHKGQLELLVSPRIKAAVLKLLLNARQVQHPWTPISKALETRPLSPPNA